MEVLNISKKSLFIVLTKEDMKKYGISAPYCGANLRRFLKSTLPQGENAKMLNVQVFESKEGGCEMFVTKIDRSTYMGLRDNYIHMTHCPIYAFLHMNDLLLACRHLKSVGQAGGNLYKEVEGEKLFLETEEEHPVLTEFGAKSLGEGAPFYLMEHCKFICTDAIEKIGNLA